MINFQKKMYIYYFYNPHKFYKAIVKFGVKFFHSGMADYEQKSRKNMIVYDNGLRGAIVAQSFLMGAIIIKSWMHLWLRILSINDAQNS